MGILIHDNDSIFGGAFDAVFESEGIRLIKTPYRAPNANAVAERWVRTVREECLDQILVLSAGHLRRVLVEYVGYYNQSRPHQGIEQRTPIPGDTIPDGTIRCRTILGGIVRDYYRLPETTNLCPA